MYEYVGNMEGAFVSMQGVCRKYTGCMQGVCMKHVGSMLGVYGGM